jgi:hypothetical protein
MRFCTACQSYRMLDGGEMQRRGKVMRWLCKDCLDQKSPSIYKSKGRSRRSQAVK